MASGLSIDQLKESIKWMRRRLREGKARDPKDVALSVEVSKEVLKAKKAEAKKGEACGEPTGREDSIMTTTGESVESGEDDSIPGRL